MAYYTLFVKTDDRWFIEFGDYKKAIVEEERRIQFPGLPKANWKIVATPTEDQDLVDAELAKLNRKS